MFHLSSKGKKKTAHVFMHALHQSVNHNFLNLFKNTSLSGEDFNNSGFSSRRCLLLSSREENYTLTLDACFHLQSLSDWRKVGVRRAGKCTNRPAAGVNFDSLQLFCFFSNVSVMCN